MICRASERIPPRRARSAWLAFALVVGPALYGCGQRGELLGVITSAGSEGGAGGGPDSPGGGRPRFGTPVAVSELNVPDAKDEDITLTGDLLEVFFMSERTGSRELWTSTRASRSEPWQAPHPVSELNTNVSEITPSVSPDGLRIWFYSAADPGGIWRSTRASRKDAWTTAQPVSDWVLPAGTTLAIGPALDESEQMVALAVLGASDMGWDLYSAARATSDGALPPFTPIAGVNGPANEHDPCLIDGGRDLFFSSTRAGEGDLFWARRAQPGQAFSSVVALDELNTPTFLESDPFLSEDRTTVFFASTRTGVADIYQAEVLSYE